MTIKINIKLRYASSADIKIIKKLLSSYCLYTGDVEKNIEGFIVASCDDKIAGCACLAIDDITELRSIAVLPNYRNRGIGSMLVDYILERARKITDIIYLRTTSPAFFEKKGFARLPDEQKKTIWKDCEECDKFNVCKQTLMRINLKQIDNMRK